MRADKDLLAQYLLYRIPPCTANDWILAFVITSTCTPSGSGHRCTKHRILRSHGSRGMSPLQMVNYFCPLSTTISGEHRCHRTTIQFAAIQIHVREKEKNKKKKILLPPIIYVVRCPFHYTQPRAESRFPIPDIQQTSYPSPRDASHTGP